MSNAGERRNSTLKGLVGGGNKSPGRKSSISVGAGPSLDTDTTIAMSSSVDSGTSIISEGGVDEQQESEDTTTTTHFVSNITTMSEPEQELNNKPHNRLVDSSRVAVAIAGNKPAQSNYHRRVVVDETASNQANDQLSDHHMRDEGEIDGIVPDEDGSSQDSESNAIPSNTGQQQHQHQNGTHQMHAHPHPHHKPKTIQFSIDKKYLAGKSADKLIREKSGYLHSQQELLDLRKKCDCYPFNFGCVVLQDAPEGDGVGYSYRLFYYCQANDICRKKLTHFELDKTHWDATEDVVVTHIRQQHWQQLLQTRHV